MQDQLTLDWCGARTNRDNAINVSLLNAESQQSDWGEVAYSVLEEYVYYSNNEFMAEDVRKYAQNNKELKNPPHQRAWGAIFSKAIKRGLIKVIRIGKVSNINAHCANANVYVRAV